MKRIAWANRLTLLSLTILPLLVIHPAHADAIDAESHLISANSSAAPEAASTLTDALLGHWMTDDGATHYYFGRNQVIVVSHLQRQDRSTVSHKQKLAYQVLAANTVTACIDLEIATLLGWAQTRRLHMGDDRQTVIETMEVMGHAFRNEWIYVDAQQQP